MTMMKRALGLAAIALPLALGGCGMMGGGASPTAVSGQAGAGTRNGPSGGATGGAQ